MVTHLVFEGEGYLVVQKKKKGIPYLFRCHTRIEYTVHGTVGGQFLVGSLEPLDQPGQGGKLF